MSTWLQYQNQIWLSRLEENTFPYSDLLNLYMNLMEQFPNEAVRISRIRVFQDHALSDLDRAVKAVLGKRLSVLEEFSGVEERSKSGIEVRNVSPFSHFDQCKVEQFESAGECEKWMHEERLRHQALLENRSVANLPRLIFSVARTRENTFIAAQNQQHLNRSFHAELQLMFWLVHQPSKFEVSSLWVSLSPCKMCAALISSVFDHRRKCSGFFFEEQDSGPMARNTALDGRITLSRWGEWSS